MKLSSWLALIGVMVGIGCLKVAERNAVYVKGYALGEQVRELHKTETHVGWLSAEVEGLASPGRLAQFAQDRRLKLVAWSTLDSQQQQRRRANALAASRAGQPTGAALTSGAAPMPGIMGGPLPLMHVAVAPDDATLEAAE